MRAYEIINKEFGKVGYIQLAESILEAIDGEFDGAEIGDEITLRLVEISKEEYEKLPDFVGW